MTISSKTWQKSKALDYLEGMTGGRLSFSKVLLTLRQTEEKSQQQLAAELGISKQHLCDIEKGRKSVRAARAASFAKSLGYPQEFFIELALQEELDKAGVKFKVKVQAA